MCPRRQALTVQKSLLNEGQSRRRSPIRSRFLNLLLFRSVGGLVQQHLLALLFVSCPTLAQANVGVGRARPSSGPVKSTTGRWTQQDGNILGLTGATGTVKVDSRIMRRYGTVFFISLS